ncbi:MAG: hypothetical protein K6A80_00620 [Saccharofermentans sp.]|nr:hypothetical protein [Saccharofermentans sp.]
MKKIITLFVTAGMLFTMASCTAQVDETADPVKETELETAENNNPGETEEEAGMRIPNPWSTFDTLDGAVESSGINLLIPDEFKSQVTAYRAIAGDMIEVRIALDGKEITVRATDVTADDISGDYNTYPVEFVQDIQDLSVAFRATDDSTVNVASWADETYSYCLISTEGISKALASDVVSSLIMENTNAY